MVISTRLLYFKAQQKNKELLCWIDIYARLVAHHHDDGVGADSPRDTRILRASDRK